MAVAAAALLHAGAARATTTPTNVPSSMYDYAKNDRSRDLLGRVDDALNALTLTYYVYSGDEFNAMTGVYKVDCSGYLNAVIEDAVPSAFDEVRDAEGVSRPGTGDYYDFVRDIPYGSTRNKWYRIERVSSLRPGDLLVWRRDDGTGHGMIVVSMPQRDTRWSNVYRLRVSDSAKSGHSSDNRGSTGSGVGAGYILLEYSTSSGRPTAYAWTTAGVWHAVSFAMARPSY